MSAAGPGAGGGGGAAEQPASLRPPSGQGVTDTARIAVATEERQGRSLPRPGQPSRPGGQTTRPRRAHLVLARVDPWSVMKTAFLLSVGFGIMIFIAVAVLWSILDAMGVFSSVSVTVNDIVGDDFDLMEYLSLSRVLGFTIIIGLLDIVFVTALATLGAFLYNLAAVLSGGVVVTFTEDT